MTNRLAAENSPYLIQHASNPVDWFPWGSEALEKARREDKPVFLSIGYAACHWCHVMAHESFEDVEVAEFLNQNFISIKVDREERPDLDSIYMDAVVAMTGQGGWPMSVFLTPQGVPFYGGTYFPPQPRFNLPSFRDVIQTIARLWRDDRERLLQTSQEIVQHIVSTGPAERNVPPLSPQILDQAVYRLAQAYDWDSGGWGQAPKFPQPMAIEFLLQRASQGDKLALDVALHCLDAMSQGGMYDVVGGGFARYSTDNNWLVPHFEKMLYDNALLAKVYLYAYLITRESKYRAICQATLDFMVREMSSDEGGFFSSLDADSGGKEGQFYIWDYSEIQSYLSKAQAQSTKYPSVNWVDFYVTAYSVTQEGNFEGKTILQKSAGNSELASLYGISKSDVDGLLHDLNRILLEKRSERIRPATDDKVLVSWNALTLTVFAEAARYLDCPAYLEIACKNATFLWDQMVLGNRLFRSWRNGKARHTAYLEDYAGLILAYISLYQSNFETVWFQRAKILLTELLSHFRDPEFGFFDTRDDHEELFMRVKDIQDNATPSGNSLAVLALIHLAAYEGESAWIEMSEKAILLVKDMLIGFPLGFGNWLCALFSYFTSIREIAMLFPPTDYNTAPYESVLWSTYRPDCIVAASTHPPEPGSPKLLQDRALIRGCPAVYVCHDFVCDLPVQTPEQLAEKLV
jgi:uncharacterized protein YyaL (SSP411 family)